MNIGYARVSTDEQNLDLQLAALGDADCDRIFSDRVSGDINHRQGLNRALTACQEGDLLVVWKLDRLGRSLHDLVNLVESLNVRGVGLKVLTGMGAQVDTTRPDGKLIFGILATLAEFERELIRERTRAGMAAARRRGVHLGRPRKLDDAQITKARQLIEAGGSCATDIAAGLGVHVNTLRRAVSGTVSK
ncbi:recombinase family protein [bacterium]|nr:recombinase family protein [bacterium]